MRRTVTTVVAAVGLACVTLSPVVAQDATPQAVSPLAELGLPELTITAAMDGLHVDQGEIPAGRYLVSLHVAVDGGPVASGFVRLVEGKTLDDLSLADELVAGTPIMGEGAPPLDLAWLYETYIASGPSSLTPQVVVNLPAGEYGVWQDDPGSVLPAPGLTVTGDADPAAITGVEPAALVTLEQQGAGGQGFAFAVDGVLQAGPQVVKIVNASDQPHFSSAFQYPDPITVDDLMGAAMFDPTTGATPAPDMVDFSQLRYVAYVPTQSPGTTTWAVLELAPGQVGVECWLPDPEAAGMPHALEGMVQIIEVTG